MKTSSRFAIIAAAGILAGGVSSAQAGGLGGDCCADLEERVAELEATTVRKGNRKVSLKLSGQVNRSIMWWDDGWEDNTYSVDNSNTSTRFRLTGSAGIMPGLSAGYKIEFDAESARSGSVDQIEDDRGNSNNGGGDGGLEVRVAEWYLKHDGFGKLTIGQGSPATDDLVKINLGGTSVATKDGLIFDTGGGFFLRQKGVSGVQGLYSNGATAGPNAVRWGGLAPGLDTSRRDRVRYDTPTIAGFTISAAWGEDDYWDVAARYAGEFKGIRMAAGLGYLEDHDEEGDVVGGVQPSRDRTEWKGSASVWAPGLMGVGPYLSASFVKREHSGGEDTFVSGGVTYQRADMNFWRVEGGIRHNFIGIGDTIAYVEYAEADDGLSGARFDTDVQNGANMAATNIRFLDSSVEMWGIGVVQRINPAAMEVFMSYRQYEADAKASFDATGLAANIQLEDLSILHAGGRIRF